MDWSWLKDPKWWRDQILAALFVGIVLAVLAWLAGFLTVPYRLEQVEKQVKKLENIDKAVTALNTSKEHLEKMATKGEENVEKLRSESKTFADSLRRDTTELRTEIQKLTQYNGELKGSVEVLKGVTADIRDLRSSIERLSMTIGSLDTNVKRHSDELAGLAKTITRIEKIAEQMERNLLQTAHNEVALVWWLDQKNLVEAGQRVWEFRIPIPEDVGEVVRISRSTPIRWPDELGDFVLDYRLGVGYIRVLLRGNFDPAKRDLLKQGRGIQVQFMIAVVPR